jgi:N-acetylglucosaminyldiphosphoundecaprenol N-acetyl-beta-D-mannosaminyltransferase
MAIDAVTMSEAVTIVREWLAEPYERCRYVVTPNVDHVVQYQEHPGLRAAYGDAGLVLADGWPVVAAARLLRRPLPARVAGSDLVPAVLQAIPPSRPARIFLLGAAPGVAERASERIERQWPGVQVVGTYSPPLGFESQPAELEDILEFITHAAPDLIIVGLGAPKQELWVHRNSDRIRAKVAICAGATIDFLAGEKQRAPRWMRRCGLEWFHRMISEPRRMVKRYLRDAWVFPRLVWREWSGWGRFPTCL